MPLSKILPSDNETVFFQGKTIPPGKDGRYKCPFPCGGSGYPKPKYKTMAGFLKHLESCKATPSAKQKAAEQAKVDEVARTVVRNKAFAECPYQVGDTIHYWYETVTKPTHVRRFDRMVRVRYEEEKLFRAYTSTIADIGFDGRDIVFNRNVRIGQICPTQDEAEFIAKTKQNSWDEHVRFSAECR